MSTTTTSERKRPRASPQGVTQCDRFIEQQLDKTSSQVKLTDLLSAVMVLAGGLLASLLVLAVIDHWILGFAPWGRWLALLTLVAGVLSYAGLLLVPLLFRHVNPAYAARAIEQSEPSLKNSLINFLLFRADRAGLSAAVYAALQQRAAADLTKVQVEGAVDRGSLIKVGYGLAAVLTIFAAYTILSPKSPFQTIERIAAPWAEIARPSRVRIEQVQPGHDVTVFCGDHLTVTAQVYDVREGEPVQLCYSTKDGQVTAAQVALRPTDGGLRYEGQLPPESDGMQQDLTYWIVAGDATTQAFHAIVEPAPTIWIEQVDYDYPRYTQKPRRTVQRQGDIQGLEGTRVTLHAQANTSIRAALIELQPSTATGEADSGKSNAGPVSSRVRVLEMDAAGQTASCSFVLELDAARTRPLYASYQVRFVTGAGQRNPRPVLHRLEVTRDLAPEIEILTPTRNRLEVPEDGQQPIEARAIDPDFGLRKVTLRAAAGGTEILSRVLFEDPQGRQGQTLVHYVFRPRELHLAAGAEVVYGLSAEDNRISTTTGTPDPNTTSTADYHFLILPAEKPAGFEADAAPPKPKPEPAATPERPRDEPQEPTPTGDQGAKDEQQTPSKDKDAGGSGGTGDEKNDKQSGGGQSGQEGQQKKGDNSGGQGSQSGQKSDSQPDSSGQTGAGAGESSHQPGDPNATGSPDATGGQGGTAGDRVEPLHEGEVFEKLLQRLQEQDGKSGQGQDQGEGLGKPPPGQFAKDATGEGKPTGESQESRPEQTGKEPSAANGKTSDSPGKPTDQMPADPPAGAQQQQPGKAQSPGKPQTPGEIGKPDKNLGGGPQEDAKPGAGGAPEGPAESGQPKPPADQGGQQQQPGTGTNGESGAGQPATEKPGAASPLGKNQDRQKQGHSGSGGEKPQQNPEPQAPSSSNKQSDSQGPEGGDRSGGGKQGAGQGANQAGHDSAGSNSPADEGAGAAGEPGTGDMSQGPGDKQPSPDKTGAKGTKPGPGSGTKPGTQAGGPGDLPNSGQPGGGPSPPTYGSPDSQQPNREGKSLPMGGGVPGQGELRGANVTGEAPPEDKPKLEYTRKATDLVLEYLKDQQQKPDEQLLHDLGWTPDDLRQFIQRWESLKHAASESEAGRRELEESLRSLGLRPAQSTGRRGAAHNDQAGGLREVGSQSSPPNLYLEQFNAFKKGTARATDRDAVK